MLQSILLPNVGQANVTFPGAVGCLSCTLHSRDALHFQVSRPTKSLDEPAVTSSGHKGDDNDDVVLDILDSEAIEGADRAAQHEQEPLEDILQHNINTVLCTLPARERNVSLLLPTPLLCLLLLHNTHHFSQEWVLSCLWLFIYHCSSPCAMFLYLIMFVSLVMSYWSSLVRKWVLPDKEQ